MATAGSPEYAGQEIQPLATHEAGQLYAIRRAQKALFVTPYFCLSRENRAALLIGGMSFYHFS
jgi:hypothetical protein